MNPNNKRTITWVVGLFLMTGLLSACAGKAEKKSDPIPKGYWNTTKSISYTYATGSQVVSNHMLYDPALKARVNYSDVGADGLWFTGDDVIQNYYVYHTAVVGNEYKLSEYSVFSTSGNDGQWFTADDVESTYTTYSHDSNGDLTSIRSFTPGPDGLLRTQDDVMGGQDFTRANGVRTDIVVYSKNFPSQCNKAILDGQGLVVQRDLYTPENDSTCFTSDDLQFAYYLYSHNTANLMSSSVFYNSGPDGLWHNLDDFASNMNTYFYDPAGNRTLSTQGSAGPDGIPNNADDVIFSKNRFAYNAEGDITYNFTQGPGPDALWGTGDEEVLSESWSGYY
ncbi:MAG: hypothetical protein OEW39_14010 [Deltaproteobacteria bacterium]|nr:hypothetical protein [Deltaproteobacteria bacterium]